MPLKVSDGIGAWIKDFQKSDAPQFKGKSKDERRDQAVAAYLSAKRGDKKEGINELSTDTLKKYHKKTQDHMTTALRTNDPDMKKKMGKRLTGSGRAYQKLKKRGEYNEGSGPSMSDLQKRANIKQSDKDKLLKVRQMLDKEKKPVKKEAMTPAQKAAHDKAVADFKKRGGKITKLPPGKAAGYHGKDDPGSGIKGMLAKGTGTKYNIRNRGKHLDKDMSESYNHMNEDFMFKVGVEGLPDMIIGGSSPGEVKARLRKIVKQPSMITSVSRMTTAEVKKRYRDMAQGKEDTSESVLEKHVYRFATKTKQGNIHHPSKDEAGAKKAIEKRTGEKVQSMTYKGPFSSMAKRRVREGLNEEAPGIIRANMALAKDGIKNAIKGLTAVAGKHSDRSTKMKANKAIKTLKQAMKEIN